MRPGVHLQCMHWKQRQDKQKTIVFKLDNHVFLSCYSHNVSADCRRNICFTCSITVAPLEMLENVIKLQIIKYVLVFSVSLEEKEEQQH